MIATRVQNWRQVIRKLPTVVYDLFALCIFLSILVPNFFNPVTAFMIGVQAAVFLIVALEETLIILTEGIDMSIGALLSLTGVVTAVLVVNQVPFSIAIFGGLLTGLAFGLVNGCLIAIGKLPPFIATLGTMGMAQGLALAITQGLSIPALSPEFRFLSEGTPFGIPMPVWIAGIVFMILYILLNNTRYGNALLAIGWKEGTARQMGIQVEREKIILYTLGGALAAIAGIVLVARMSSAHPIVGIGYEFDGIAATLLGGTSFSQGRGGLGGTILGVLFVAVLKTGLNALDISSWQQLVIVGVILISAIVLETFAKQRGWREG